MATNQLAASNKRNEWKKYVIRREGKDSWQCRMCSYGFHGGRTRFAMHILGPKKHQKKQVKQCSAKNDPDYVEAKEMFLLDIPLTVRDEVLLNIHSEPINIVEEKQNEICGNMIREAMQPNDEQSNASGSTTYKKTVQPSIEKWMATAEKEECDMLLKKWAVCCRVHFRKLEHPYFRAYSQKVSMLPSGYLPPKRYGFSPPKLIPLYCETEKWKLAHTKAQTTSCTIICDGWEDNRIRSCANFLVLYANDPAGPIHLGTIDCQDYEKNANYIAMTNKTGY
mmetsp:Transcript_22332/g.28929  ORF Transcript_22332/g.28929 Transcript_22332/m.28929 type:complete len:280 (+) Transcript_22332:100-939(+)